jgi:hypothetical protein
LGSPALALALLIATLVPGWSITLHPNIHLGSPERIIDGFKFPRQIRRETNPPVHSPNGEILSNDQKEMHWKKNLET